MAVLDNLGYIKNAAYFPCHKPDPMLIIQAAGHAGLIVLWEAATFSCVDTIRLRAGISPWHSRGLKGLINKINPPEVQKGVNKLYKFIIPAEKLLFFFFVVDMTVGFFAHWQSMIFKLGACGDTADACNWSGFAPSWTSPHPGSEMLVTYNTSAISGHCQGTPSNGFFVPGGHYFNAYFDIKVQSFPFPPFIQNVTTWLETAPSGGFKFHPIETPAPWYANDITGKYMINGQNKHSGGRTYYFKAGADGIGFAVGGTASVTTSAQPLLNDRIIPMSCFGAGPSSPPP